MKKRIALLGPPASGKGTQAEMIKSKLRIDTASPGAMLREQKRAGTPLGIQADEITRGGQLLPDPMIVSLIEAWLRDHDSAFVFDGFPRTLGQAEMLEKLLGARNTPLEVVFSLEADFGTIKDRVSRRLVCEQCGNVVSAGAHVPDASSPCPRCGGPLHRRQDDDPSALHRRMDEYREKSEPLVAHYANNGLLRSIDAARSAEQVFADIESVLEK